MALAFGSARLGVRRSITLTPVMCVCLAQLVTDNMKEAGGTVVSGDGEGQWIKPLYNSSCPDIR